MTTQLIKNGRKWSLYSALFAVTAYLTLTLTSEPAYAATCTTQICAEANALCNGICEAEYHIPGVNAPACVVGSSGFYCDCPDIDYRFGVPC
jgi:hypothetical protein